MRTPAPDDIAQEILAPFIGREVDLDDSERAPRTMNDGIVEELRRAVNARGYFLRLHLDNIEMFFSPPPDPARKFSETPSVHAWIVPCEDGKWRLGATKDARPKTPAQKLADSFTAGSEKNIGVQKPLRVSPRRKPPSPGRGGAG